MAGFFIGFLSVRESIACVVGVSCVMRAGVSVGQVDMVRVELRRVEEGWVWVGVFVFVCVS